MEDCYGCKTCAVACKSKNQTGKGVNFRKTRTLTTENPHTLSYISMACNHCDDPKCAEVCPVSAYTKQDDGIVVQDHDRCLACRSCVMACPYAAPQYDPVEKKVSKCDMCVDLVEQGLEPKCVELCPGNVLKFGEIDELKAEFGNDLEVIERQFDLPSHKISKPNIVIVAAN